MKTHSLNSLSSQSLNSPSPLPPQLMTEDECLSLTSPSSPLGHPGLNLSLEHKTNFPDPPCEYMTFRHCNVRKFRLDSTKQKIIFRAFEKSPYPISLRLTSRPQRNLW